MNMNMKIVSRASRHGKAHAPRTSKENPTLDSIAVRRGVTAREIVQKGLAASLRQARKLLQKLDKRKLDKNQAA